ncbi:hypothetical protein POJ06DRAFT_256795 [Lipomyces tetrasporus]|uniref:RING-type E3 ubiquitin transferase n=1 Tax=Lipomyces tetrasporus TaxID=54092 RepID=A0AAD7VRX1_9ASCO|nr:uncharacterized protein POJ06DRAFT_256795 [Lipomyces tetrasporus]KAJ8099371.1 hypothetical protein POJ06DRAFT_256795 [Lipomyces tetrasporus]
MPPATSSLSTTAAAPANAQSSTANPNRPQENGTKKGKQTAYESSGSSSSGSGPKRRNNKSKKVTKFLAGDKEPVDALNKQTEEKTSGEAENGELMESAAPAEPGESAEICFICAEPVKYSAVSPCNHRSCHICALRMRALYKTNACVHCRTIQPKIIFTIDNAKKYEDYTEGDIACSDNKLGIDFDRREIMDDVRRLQRFNCPDPNCDQVCTGWADLRRHVTEVHKKYMCQLCTRNKKVFIYEHKLYSHKALLRHERVGDEDGFTGHPECQFCKTRFYSSDELRVHYREQHERCHICDQRLTGNSEPQYFLNYDSLEKHFRDQHFLCPATACLEKKFVVFENEIDLKAHQVSEHPNIFGTSKSARTIEANFHFVEPVTSSRSRPTIGSSSSRGPQNEWQQPSQSSSSRRGNNGQVPRDQLALQRSIAAGTGSRSFGTQLSTDFGQPTAPPVDSGWTTVPIDDSVPPSSSRSRSAVHIDDHSASDLDLFRRQRLDERAAQLLTRGSYKYESFRKINDGFRNSNISAKAVIQGYVDFFDTDINEMTIIVHEFVELFNDDKQKKAELLSAWGEWRARNADFPELPSSGNGKVSHWKAQSNYRPVGSKPVNTGSVWGGHATTSASSPSSSSSRPNLRDMPSLLSLTQQLSSSHITIPMSSQTRQTSQSTLATPMAPPPSASAAYANTWVPASTPTPAPQKLTFATRKPKTTSDSPSLSSFPSASSSTLPRKNLKDFPSLPTVKKSPSSVVASSSKAAAAPVNGWARSASTTVKSSEDTDESQLAGRKKGKKGTIVFRLG